MPPGPTAGQLLGRTRELATLTDLLGIGEPARPGAAVLLGGDAGMGKTRLLTELADAARAAGWRLMVGHCLDFADSLLPYLPFSEMVGRFAAEDPETAALMAAASPALSALTPGRRLMSGRPGDRAGDGATVDADDVDRAQLFESMHAGLEAVADEGPLLVVVEDLHWADRSTRDLLSFLFARHFQGPVGLVGSYRSEDLHRRHPLRAALAQWTRLPGVHRMQLGPLPDSDVRRLVQALQQAPLPEREISRIVGRAEGNAFFVEELVGASQLDRAGGALPDDLADLLLVRLDRLDDGARQVVRAASCAGRRVSHALLSAVVALPEAELELALRSAVESNVLVRVGDDGYAFRHALLAEAVYDDLLPGERVRLHAAYVRALCGPDVDGTAAELATHARAAHDVPTAIRAGIRAGEEAMAVGGPDDAAKHFEAVLELVARPGQQLPDVDLAGLVTRTSEAVIATGHAGRAMRLVREHLDQASADLAPRDRARLLLAWAAAALLNEVDEAPADATSEALALVGEEPGRLRTRALSLHARALVMAQRDEEAAKYAGEALAMAQRYAMTQVAAEAATTLAALDERLGDAETALRALGEVVAEARASGDVAAEMRGRYHLAYVHLERGRLAEAQELFRQTAAAASAAGTPWAPYGFDARYHQAMTALLRGEWDEAVAVADYAGESPPGDHEAVLLTVRLLVAAGRGDDLALREYDVLKPRWERESLIASNSGAAALDLLGHRGDTAGMWRIHDEVVHALSRNWSPLFQARVRLSALVLGHIATAVGRAPAPERPALTARVPELVEAVEQVRRKALDRPRGLGPEGQAWVARAHAEHLRLRWLAGEEVDLDELVSSWAAAVERFGGLGHLHEQARSQVRLAAVLAAAGRSSEATPVAAAARQTAERLRAEPLLTELEATGPGTVPRTGVRLEGRGVELTPREREILALVAQGRTNGDIGRQLFISTKTVSVHVSNILAKLGAGGRTEAAAIGRRLGLVTDD